MRFLTARSELGYEERLQLMTGGVMRLWLTALLPFVGLLADGPMFDSGPRSQGSLHGAWRVIGMSLTSGDQITTSTSPGLVLFTEKHYSLMYVEGSQPRKLFADPTRPTDTEKIGAYDTFVGHSGIYTITDSVIAMLPDIAKAPHMMIGEMRNTFFRFAYHITGDTLRLTRWNPRGAFTMLLVRAE